MDSVVAAVVTVMAVGVEGPDTVGVAAAVVTVEVVATEGAAV